MKLFETSTPEVLTQKAKALYRQEREQHKILNGWFLSREIAADVDEKIGGIQPELRAAAELSAVIEKLPLEISENAILAGTQRDAFAASYTNRVLFIKDGAVFNELRRGDESRDAFFSRIMEVVSFLGGEAGHVS